MYVIIVGCGNIGAKLANSLSEENHDVVIIDSNPDNFNQLGSGFNGVIVQGVPLDEDVLINAGIERADALAAVTPDDNMNVTVSQVAREIYKVPKVITRIHDPERELIFQQLGLNTISPVSLFAGQVKNILNEKMCTVCHSFGNKNVGFKFYTPDKKYTGKQIKDINIDDNCLIFGIIRDSEFHFAKPLMKIEERDNLVLGEYVS